MAIKRIYYDRLLAMMEQFPAVGLIGPRQCGKTTTALLVQRHLKKNNALYFDLESPADYRMFSDAELFLQQHRDSCIIIDEVQRLPELFAILRSVIDRKRKPGRFLLLGSASPDMVKGISESLAGRIYYLEAHPFHFLELPAKKNTLAKHWFRGGFPDAWLAKNDDAVFAWIDGFVRTFVERDLNMLFGTNFSPQMMFRLWRMLAHHHGGVWNAQSFAKGLDVSPTTVNRYVDFLEGAFMLRKLAPYFTNTKKRLLKTPKIYLRDSGVLHYLLDIHSADELKFHPALGNSWEGYVIEQIISVLPRTVQPFYYRTHDGSEMDLVLAKGVKVVACIEVKNSLSPPVTKGMKESIRDLNSKHNYIVTPGDTPAYPLTKQVVSCGFVPFIKRELNKILQ
jgi:predicted AAA+ superfamily ATPase